MSEQPVVSQEIIIVRRSNGDGDGGHHGGAWKIAYADFVTAMMAFFLVMWLVNSANEVTKSRVASYFNPIKMTDAAPNARGLKSTADKKQTEGTESEATRGPQKKASLEKENLDSAAEEMLLKDPFSRLDEIVLRAATESGSAQRDIINQTTGDPFDPKAWEALRNGNPNTKEPPAATVKADTTSEQSRPTKEKAIDSHVASKTAKSEPAGAVPGNVEPEKPVPKLLPDPQEGKDAAQLETKLQGIVDKHKADLDISVEVRATEEGVLIMLGDNSGQGMFGIGSAEPSPGLIEIVGVIGKLLSQQRGGVVVRGHTDSRQYRKGRRDNWQLSTDRAHMASYMLMRGGLEESRIMRIEGHGAATPLLPSSPMADSNRRVEFLLQTMEERK
jgi:chemotaxis protein MotB